MKLILRLSLKAAHSTARVRAPKMPAVKPTVYLMFFIGRKPESAARASLARVWRRICDHSKKVLGRHPRKDRTGRDCPP